jgi:hypothetical protein
MQYPYERTSVKLLPELVMSFSWRLAAKVACLLKLSGPVPIWYAIKASRSRVPCFLNIRLRSAATYRQIMLSGDQNPEEMEHSSRKRSWVARSRPASVITYCSYCAQ